MNTRPHLQPLLNNSLAIRQEIQRFESVHPSIYAIYDLIELVPNASVAQQIRDHVVCIEGKASCDLHFKRCVFTANISALVLDYIL
jgi:Arf-GAP/GTPase/ANK repeat/PH domain-containing protein 1/3